jgi:hypothetical protein
MAQYCVCLSVGLVMGAESHELLFVEQIAFWVRILVVWPLLCGYLEPCLRAQGML